MKEKKKYLDYSAIKTAVSVYEVLDRHYHLGETMSSGVFATGTGYSGPCPMCEARLGQPFSILVSGLGSSWSCLAKCDAGGNVLDLVARMENTGTYGAAKLLTEWFDIDAEKKAEDKEPDAKTNGTASGKGYLGELDKELKALLSAGDDAETIRFMKAKVLESYRNGQQAPKRTA